MLSSTTVLFNVALKEMADVISQPAMFYCLNLTINTLENHVHTYGNLLMWDNRLSGLLL